MSFKNLAGSSMNLWISFPDYLRMYSDSPVFVTCNGVELTSNGFYCLMNRWVMYLLNLWPAILWENALEVCDSSCTSCVVHHYIFQWDRETLSFSRFHRRSDTQSTISSWPFCLLQSPTWVPFFPYVFYFTYKTILKFHCIARSLI